MEIEKLPEQLKCKSRIPRADSLNDRRTRFIELSELAVCTEN
jgi:hypothetical protein